MDKSTVLRAARKLSKAQVLIVEKGTIRIQPRWVAGQKPVHGRTGATVHPKRCTSAPLFRRAKDSSKERYKYIASRHSAGAAQPVPGKYEAISRG